MPVDLQDPLCQLTHKKVSRILPKALLGRAYHTTLMPTNRAPTITDVARHAKVSIATVNRVLNSSTSVHPERTELVRIALEELEAQINDSGAWYARVIATNSVEE